MFLALLGFLGHRSNLGGAYFRPAHNAPLARDLFTLQRLTVGASESCYLAPLLFFLLGLAEKLSLASRLGCVSGGFVALCCPIATLRWLSRFGFSLLQSLVCSRYLLVAI